MAAITNAEAALLGLLAEGPRHPYQIEKDVAEREMRFWTELSMSSIYKLLRKCERSGLVKRTNTISPENRLRALYAISPKGRRALEEKVEALISEPGHVRWPFDIGIYNCGLLPRRRARAALERCRAGLEERVRCYEALRDFLRGEGCPEHHVAIATRPLFLARAELKWVDDFLRGMKGRRA
ncbi:MAG: PadR family transcriptional regulator [bacterium]|nr:PadR family transcriptional regulator [bacterium]